ncbi:hypothetical protein [Aquipuribacter sp. SD81]|uniref:hypothetical protein n=1 Tax=Aquipuribacter sp. SD81 TaxID=3127703 RepID=UPI00301AE6F9
MPDWARSDALDRHVLREFESLGERRSEELGRRLVAAYVLADEGDTRGALAHAAVVRVLGSRLAAAREAVGVIAYRCGDYEEALRDLKAARRISGRWDTLPVMADCERGLGRPERALELAASREASQLDRDGRVEMLLVAAGARQDLGQADAAVLTLQVPELESRSEAAWHQRLVAGYAEALEQAGRSEEAALWRSRAERHPAAPRVGDDAGGDDVGDIVDLDPDAADDADDASSTRGSATGADDAHDAEGADGGTDRDHVAGTGAAEAPATQDRPDEPTGEAPTA